MVHPGKNFPGQGGYPTPNSTPDDTVRRIFIVPNSEEWLGLVEGAIQTLLDEWRFYQWGELTPAEAVAAFNAVILASYSNVCACERPGGGKFVRIGYGGHIEELGEDGTWQEPTGDYAPPVVPAREGGTPQDQQCLAAANAANVLQMLYENLSDSWNSTLTTAEAQTAFLLGIAALIAAPFGLAGEAIVAIAGLAFQVAYEVLEFVTADLWDETFTAALQCILYTCSTNTDGVVTFDMECVNNELSAETNIFDLTASQLRLFGQIQWIFSMIGVDGLNSAGATTAITEADCTACAPTSWVYEWDVDELSSWDNCFGRGTYSAGVGWISSVGTGYVASTPNSGNNSSLHANPNHWEIDVTASGAAGNGYVSVAEINGFCDFGALDPGYASLDGVPTYPGYGLVNGSATYTYDDDGLHDFSGVFVNAVINDEDAQTIVTRVRLSGTGFLPPFTGGHIP